MINGAVRTYEYQADSFALRFGRGENLISGLVKLFKANKAGLDPDPWYSTLTQSHPTLLERIRAMDNLSKKSK